MIDSERVEKAAKAMWDDRNIRSWACAGFQQQEYRVMARAALTADAQPVEDAPQVCKLPCTRWVYKENTAHPGVAVCDDCDTPMSHLVTGVTTVNYRVPEPSAPTPEPLMYKDADALESFGNDEKSRRLAAVKGACARAAEFGRHAQHGYAGRNADSWLFGWDYCNDCLSRSDYKPPAGQEMFPSAAPLYSLEQIEKVLASSIYESMLRDERGKRLTVAELMNRLRSRLTARERVTVHPATEKTRPWEESVCKHCGKAIWRMTDGHGHGWMHKDQIPNLVCIHPRTQAEPVDAERYANGLRQELAQQKAAKEEQ